MESNNLIPLVDQLKQELRCAQEFMFPYAILEGIAGSAEPMRSILIIDGDEKNERIVVYGSEEGMIYASKLRKEAKNQQWYVDKKFKPFGAESEGMAHDWVNALASFPSQDKKKIIYALEKGGIGILEIKEDKLSFTKSFREVEGKCRDLIVNDEQIYVAVHVHNGHIYIFDGELNYNKKIPTNDFPNSLVLFNRRNQKVIIYGSNDNHIHFLEPNKDQEVFPRHLPTCDMVKKIGILSQQGNSFKFCAASEDGCLYGFDDQGKFLWPVERGRTGKKRIRSMHVIHNNLVVTSSDYGGRCSILQFRNSEGIILWKYLINDWVLSINSIVDDQDITLLLGLHDTNLVLLCKIKKPVSDGVAKLAKINELLTEIRKIDYHPWPLDKKRTHSSANFSAFIRNCFTHDDEQLWRTLTDLADPENIRIGFSRCESDENSEKGIIRCLSTFELPKDAIRDVTCFEINNRKFAVLCCEDDYAYFIGIEEDKPETNTTKHITFREQGKYPTENRVFCAAHDRIDDENINHIYIGDCSYKVTLIKYELNDTGYGFPEYEWSKELDGSGYVRGIYIHKKQDGKKTVLVGGGNCDLHILDSNGRIIKVFEIKQGKDTSPMVRTVGVKSDDGHCIYLLGLGNGKLVATLEEDVENNTYKPLWEWQTRDWVVSIAIGDIDKDGKNEIIIGSEDHFVYVLTPEGGLKWKYKLSHRVSKVYILSFNNNNWLLASSWDGRLYLFDHEGNLFYRIKVSGAAIRGMDVFPYDSDNRVFWMIAGTDDDKAYLLELNVEEAGKLALMNKDGEQQSQDIDYIKEWDKIIQEEKDFEENQEKSYGKVKIYYDRISHNEFNSYAKRKIDLLKRLRKIGPEAIKIIKGFKDENNLWVCIELIRTIGFLLKDNLNNSGLSKESYEILCHIRKPWLNKGQGDESWIRHEFDRAYQKSKFDVDLKDLLKDTATEEINLCGQMPKKLPDQLFSLNRLKRLNLSDNRIGNLDERIFGLKDLEELDLRKTQLVTIPSGISKLTKLKRLWLNKNKLSDLPKSIRDLKMEIKWMDDYEGGIVLENNPFEASLINAIKQGRDAVEKYFEKPPRNKIFICYAHDDDPKYLEMIQQNLKVMKLEGLPIELWSDKHIRPGQIFLEEIKKAIESAKIAILLVSTNFLASDFIQNQELPMILKGAKEEGAHIIPVIIERCRYDKSKDLEAFQAFNRLNKPFETLSKKKLHDKMYELTLVIEEFLNLPSL